jgi:hypothetical protein
MERPEGNGRNVMRGKQYRHHHAPPCCLLHSFVPVTHTPAPATTTYADKRLLQACLRKRYLLKTQKLLSPSVYEIVLVIQKKEKRGSVQSAVCERRVDLLVCSLPLHRHSYIGFILAFASSIHNKQTIRMPGDFVLDLQLVTKDSGVVLILVFMDTYITLMM